jgi:hypothetical protein
MKLKTKITLIAMAVVAPSLNMVQAQEVDNDTALVERLKQLEIEILLQQ